MAITETTLTHARLMATMGLTGSWAEGSSAPARGMAGDMVGVVVGEAVGATAITGALVMATDAAVMSDVVMQDEDTRVPDTGVVARSAALRAAASMVGPQVDSTVAAVAAVVSTAEVVAMEEAAVTGNQHLHRIAWKNGWRPALPAGSLCGAL
jgi:hypothetical protein